MPTAYVNFMCSNEKHAEEIKGSLSQIIYKDEKVDDVQEITNVKS